ncbi:NADH-quinone oxidoreductase subunit L [Salinisphaera sp. P385]|uniref:NADH-quinone oxidoreductase subunit L n=1 Tax=Spectribacter acetivorans TaxID=3075603 RepID=A0ABU3B743_9GAMM|nr:NADH-quinone oxidoreductase subunit L [Salinisphaera sp. P385]MDT0617988.1 NADH-quinone oxidoreductase subunit L [Salinisphaera sp. P385]
MTSLALIPLCPLLGAVLLSFGYRLGDRAAVTIGVGSMALSLLATAQALNTFAGGDGGALSQTLWTWFTVGDLAPDVSLYLDGLTATMVGVIVGVGFLIHLFAGWYMRHDLEGGPGMTRFFAYMNLFVFSMLVLVLADNLLLLFLGWEGVGLCSYLLIGFYYKEPANAWAAFKAFIVTRVGDVFLVLGLFVLFAAFGTLHIPTLLAQAPEVWAEGDAMATLAAFLLLGGAVGKSAQLPLQTWLADAMAGPTPVSALIHAATMVTAGVYLIARMHGLFELAPTALYAVGIVGALTLLMAGFAALAQTDIKRVLAYSTMSQIGYMFLALGAGAWEAAIFHLMTHAFFKALLFLASGSVIIACHHEQNIFRMGGLARTLKFDYALFLIGGAALAALPLVTAGFYSKDEILWLAFANGYPVLWLAGLTGALLTSIYTFRMIFIVFHGPAHTEAHPGHGLAHHLPLILLALLSTFLGAWIHPPVTDLFGTGHGGDHSHALKLTIEILSSVVAIVGVGIAAGLFLGSRERVARLVADGHGARLWQFWHHAWGFDALYDRVFVRPYLALVRLHRIDWINDTVNLIPALALKLNARLTATQTGQLRWYALVLFAAATAFLLLLLVP